MKEHLRQLAAAAANDLVRTCLVREYLQARILESLQDGGAFLRWTFVGGTALRFLFGIPRFSLVASHYDSYLVWQAGLHCPESKSHLHLSIDPVILQD